VTARNLLDALGHHVRVEDDFAVDVAGGAAGGLDQAGRAAQVPFLVRVKNRDQRDFGEVQALAQEIDADEHIKFALAQGAKDFDPFDRVNFAVQVADVDAQVAQVIGQFLRGTLGQGGYERALLAFGAGLRTSSIRSSICPFSGLDA
jgi:hypothetical protein